ncbi:hypothetical protein D3C76_1215670 [compost metagenome]
MRERFDRFRGRGDGGQENASRQDIAQRRTDLAGNLVDLRRRLVHLLAEDLNPVLNLDHHRQRLVILVRDLFDRLLRAFNSAHRTLQLGADQRADKGNALKLGHSAGDVTDRAIHGRQHFIGTALPHLPCRHYVAQRRLQLLYVVHGRSLVDVGDVG